MRRLTAGFIFFALVVKPVIPTLEPINLLFTGDVMLGRHVGELIRRHGTAYLFERIDFAELGDFDDIIILLSNTPQHQWTS